MNLEEGMAVGGESEHVARNDALRRLQMSMAETVSEIVQHIWDSSAETVDTPIERLFLTAFISIGLLFEDTPRVHRDPNIIKIQKVRGVGIIVQPQAWIGDYRVDFLIHYKITRDDKPAYESLVVECDGHEFHEKTKEQAARDKARDRYLQSAGLKVFHFTGSELYRDPDCVVEIIKVIARARGIAL